MTAYHVAKQHLIRLSYIFQGVSVTQAPVSRMAEAVQSDSMPRIKVFVHLAQGFGAVYWRQRWENGDLIGINDMTPYGYGRAAAMHCTVDFSEDAPESLSQKATRLGLRLTLGFDYLHARRNARAIFDSDVVWTHTESQYLAIALLFSLNSKIKPRPKLLGQTIWMFDRWKTLSSLRRAFYRKLISQVDLLTVHSPDNLAIAQRIFPDRRVEKVLFGISEHNKIAPRQNEGAVKIISVGNDRHRDWKTAIAAVSGLTDVSLKIISSTADPRLAKGESNVEVVRVKTNDQLLAEFAGATLMLVPLKSNHHASGITVMQEAALCGLPVIATDTGGLRDYFTGDQVRYVPPTDPGAIRGAIESLVADPEAARQMALNAQARMSEFDLGATSFVRRHVKLSRELLGHVADTRG